MLSHSLLELIDKTLFGDDGDSPDADLLFKQFVMPKLSLRHLFGYERCPRKALIEILGDNPDMKFLSLIPDERTGKKLVDEPKLDQLIEVHLIVPCRYYVEGFGPELFDQAWLYKAAIPVKESDREFYFGWSYFKLCDLFLKKKHILLADSVQSIENPTSMKYH